VDGVSLDIQKIIFHQLKKADNVVVFACTAGPNIGEWSKDFMDQGDMIRGYIVDVIGSEIVEMAMDKIQAILSDQMSTKGLKITNRYSPGYCSWSVAEQHKLFSLLPNNFCNIKLTDTALMYPIKSVSGIIGAGKNVRYNPYTCQLCDSKNCLYRNRKS
jgi:cobalamin-dependent methionine synthase I